MEKQEGVGDSLYCGKKSKSHLGCIFVTVDITLFDDNKSLILRPYVNSRRGLKTLPLCLLGNPSRYRML